MAVDEQRAYHDMYGMTFRDWDERVQLGEWVYYVRGVKRVDEMHRPQWQPSWSGQGAIVDALIYPFFLLYRWWVGRDPWTVAVARLGYVGSWNSLTPKVVHAETLVGDT